MEVRTESKRNRYRYQTKPGKRWVDDLGREGWWLRNTSCRVRGISGILISVVYFSILIWFEWYYQLGPVEVEGCQQLPEWRLQLKNPSATGISYAQGYPLETLFFLSRSPDPDINIFESWMDEPAHHGDPHEPPGALARLILSFETCPDTGSFASQDRGSEMPLSCKQQLQCTDLSYLSCQNRCRKLMDNA